MARPTFIWTVVAAAAFPVAAAAVAGMVVAPPQAPGTGVILPGDSWRESVPMQSMGFLRGSVSGIDEQVDEIAEITKDVSLTQEDLKDQEKLWHQAEAQLQRENAELQAQILKLRQLKEDGAGLGAKVDELRAKLEEVEKENATLTWEFEVEAQRARARQQAYNQRAMQLDEYLASIERSALAEEAQIHKQQLSLQTNTAKLQLQEKKLEAKLADLQRELKLQTVEMDAKTQDLEKEANNTEDELSRVRREVVPKKEMNKELQEYEADLQHQKTALLSAKEEQVEESQECRRRTQERDSVLSVEQHKASERHEAMLAICTRAHTERGAIEQALHACEER